MSVLRAMRGPITSPNKIPLSTRAQVGNCCRGRLKQPDRVHVAQPAEQCPPFPQPRHTRTIRNQDTPEPNGIEKQLLFRFLTHSETSCFISRTAQHGAPHPNTSKAKLLTVPLFVLKPCRAPNSPHLPWGPCKHWQMPHKPPENSRTIVAFYQPNIRPKLPFPKPDPSALIRCGMVACKAPRPFICFSNVCD
jgi:hypothetical protein